MRRVIVPMASVLAGAVWLAGCASAPPSDGGPLSPVGDMSQIGNNAGAGVDHDFTGVPRGIGGGVDDGPAVSGGMHGSGTGVGGQ